MRWDQRRWLGVVAGGAVRWNSEVCVPVVLRDGENLTCWQMGEKGVRAGAQTLGRKAQGPAAPASCLL